MYMSKNSYQLGMFHINLQIMFMSNISLFCGQQGNLLLWPPYGSSQGMSALCQIAAMCHVSSWIFSAFKKCQNLRTTHQATEREFTDDMMKVILFTRVKKI